MSRSPISTLSFSVAAALLSLAGASQAGPSPLTHHGFSSAGSANVNVGPTNQGGNVAASAGAFNVTWGGATFFTYCVELTQYARLNQTHPYEQVDALAYFSSNYLPLLAADASTVVDRLGRLFSATNGVQLPTGGTLGSWTYSAAQASAAMQLAVWEIVYEGQTGSDSFDGLSLAGGAFKENTGNGTAANIRNLSNSFLASAAAVTDVQFDISVLRSAANQDYLMATRLPRRNNDVPLPGTLALAGLGLAALVVLRRRGA